MSGPSVWISVMRLGACAIVGSSGYWYRTFHQWMTLGARAACNSKLNDDRLLEFTV